MKQKNDCIFCGEHWTLERSVLIGKKFICVKCLKRLGEMIKFFETADEFIYDFKLGEKP